MLKKIQSEKRFINLILIFVIALFFGMAPSIPQEGMYPLSEVHKLNLKDAGLKIDKKEIYNPDGVSLVDALVNLGGCTASFVSEDGLILTNHHCAFRAINNASTTDNNYLEKGFVAHSQSEEYPANGYTCRITESYKDVSDEVLNAAEGIDDVVERLKVINNKMDEIAERESDPEKSIEADVSEMFEGKTYVLFKYRIIKDVRLVYAPPRSIGNFGGETDNWIWPRHTGDFSFMRAYVSPDGSAAEYSKDNVPYHPKKYLKVNPNGVHDGDFAFILGYPARTYRNRPSQFLVYQQDYQLPFVADLYEWIIDTYEDISADSPELQLKYASLIKGYANVKKNYRGKLLGLRRTGLVEKKIDDEQKLQNFIESDTSLKEKYGTLLNQIDEAYNKLFEVADADLWFRYTYRASAAIQAADFILKYAKEMQKSDDERDNPFKEKNLPRTISRVNYYLHYFNNDFESLLLSKMFNDALNLPENSQISAIEDLVSTGDAEKIIDDFVDYELLNTNLIDKQYFDELLKKTPEEILQTEDPLLDFVKELNEQRDEINKITDKIEGSLNKLNAQLVNVKMMWQKTSFIPDANRTLRLTYGHIKGYSPADAIYYSPITTLSGVIDKSKRGIDDYAIPDKLQTLYDKKDFGRFYDEKVGGVPVAILYDMDTTGGNSGSPIMDAYGNMVGINFDRAYEATINDYAWDESYSRSIGVDIRYVLWITQKFGNAGYLLTEMGVN